MQNVRRRFWVKEQSGYKNNNADIKIKQSKRTELGKHENPQKYDLNSVIGSG
jgi:hypothetical protein